MRRSLEISGGGSQTDAMAGIHGQFTHPTKPSRVTADGLSVQLPFTDTYRTLCEAPTAELRRVFEQGRELSLAA